MEQCTLPATSLPAPGRVRAQVWGSLMQRHNTVLFQVQALSSPHTHTESEKEISYPANRTTILKFD